MALLSFGSWVSLEHIRSFAGSELLIGVNDTKAAAHCKLLYDSWPFETSETPQCSSFVEWTAQHVRGGHLTAIGVYKRTNEVGDPDYDHIVPIVGCTTDSDQVTQKLEFYDLWGDKPRSLPLPSAVATRSNCRTSTTPQQPYGYCLPKNVNYGIALLGNVDKNSETFHTTLTMPSWTEPDYGKEDGLSQQPVPFTVSATIYGLTAGTSYTVLRFDSPSTVPTKNFLSGSYTHKWTFTATGSTYSLKDFDTFMSNTTMFYRTVMSLME